VESAGNCLLGGFFKACSEMVNNAVELVFGNDWTEVEASQLVRFKIDFYCIKA